MSVLAVINPKGGIGKSTISTHVAAYWASQGHHVMLGDIDRQQSSAHWLRLRPRGAAPIATWELVQGSVVKPPKGTTHLVLDTPAGLHGKKLAEVLKIAQKVIIPIQPSLFDIMATQEFLTELEASSKTAGIQFGVVGMRVDDRTLSAQRLRDYAESLHIPVISYLRETQNYVQSIAQGLTIFDDQTERTAKDREQWQPICAWLDR